MIYKDHTNSYYFHHEGNRATTPEQAESRYNIVCNIPDLPRIQTFVRYQTQEQYDAYIQANNIKPEFEYNEEGEVIAEHPFQTLEGQQKGVLNLGDTFWVLKMALPNTGLLHPFSLPQGGFIPLNEIDAGNEQVAMVFNSQEDVENYISVHQIDMSNAWHIWELNPELLNQ